MKGECYYLTARIYGYRAKTDTKQVWTSILIILVQAHAVDYLNDFQPSHMLLYPNMREKHYFL